MITNSDYIITAIGSYIPERKLTSFDFEKMVDTSDEWIIKRTGIHTKFISADNEFASDLGIKAVQDLMDNYSVILKDIDMIVATVFVPDHFTPSTSAIVAEHFGMNMAGTYDLHAESSSFTYGLITANAFIASGQANKVLIITAETPSKEIDYTDRGTCILFGGAATATLIEKTTSPKKFASNFGTNSNLADNVYYTQFSQGKLEKKQLIQQDDRALYTCIVKNISSYIKCLLDEAGLTTFDIDWFVPHSINLHMIESLRERLEFDKSKILTCVEQLGNTSSSSIPLAITSALKDGRIKRGDKILVYEFGEGITYAGAIIEW